MKPTPDQYRIASYLNLDPRDPGNWPIRIIDRLILLERYYGREALLYALTRLTSNWPVVMETYRRGRR